MIKEYTLKAAQVFEEDKAARKFESALSHHTIAREFYKNVSFQWKGI